MRFSVAAIVSALAAVASAVTPADTSKPPSGNSISLPGLDEQVPAGKPYTITWNPTTPGKVSILLLRGPSNNVVPIATLADAVPNSGNFEWTPATSLEPDVTHYGLQIIVEGTGQYQYSTQFGIKNDGKDTEDPEHTQPTYPTEVPEPTYPTEVPEPTYPTEVPEPTYSAEPTYTWVTVSVPTPPVSSSATPSSTPPTSYTPVVPTSSAAPAPPQYTGAAGRNSAASLSGVAVAGLVALFAL